MNVTRPLSAMLFVLFLMGQTLTGAATLLVASPAAPESEPPSIDAVTSRESDLVLSSQPSSQVAAPLSPMSEGGSCPAATSGSRLFLPIITRNGAAASVAADSPLASSTARNIASLLPK